MTSGFRQFLCAAAIACAGITTAYAAASASDELTRLATQKLQRGDVAGAIRDTSEAIRLYPDRASAAYALRGTIRLATGDAAGAKADLDRSIELTPEVKGMERVYAARANLNWLAGDRAAAAADIARAMQLNESFGMAYNLRARLKSDAGDLDGAQADYDRAIALEPKLMAAYSGRAAVNFQAGRLQESIGDYKTILWVKPNDAEAIATHGLLRGILGETPQAIDDLLKARVIDQRTLSAQASAPVRLLDQFLEMNPNEARARLMRGAVNLMNGEREAAERQFAQAVRADASLQSDVVAIRSRLKPAS